MYPKTKVHLLNGNKCTVRFITTLAKECGGELEFVRKLRNEKVFERVSEFAGFTSW
jgi:hypothetical protein